MAAASPDWRAVAASARRSSSATPESFSAASAFSSAGAAGRIGFVQHCPRRGHAQDGIRAEQIEPGHCRLDLAAQPVVDPDAVRFAGHFDSGTGQRIGIGAVMGDDDPLVFGHQQRAIVQRLQNGGGAGIPRCPERRHRPRSLVEPA
ncbi:MAG: hypothetical protein WDN69_14720 [Aliidongia sp.]